MPKLTKADRVEREKLRISRLTTPHRQHFKIIFSHQIERSYGFSSMSGLGDMTKTFKLLKALGKFIDATVRLPISQVEEKYKRPTDTRDGTHDPEAEDDAHQVAQIIHFALHASDESVEAVIGGVRLHGYFRANGYFVITRLDWDHSFHSVSA
jgi:hypothetical protein